VATNSFLKFNESNTNIQTYAQYLAATERLNGFPFGSKPSSILTNRNYRDNAAMVYALGEFMKNQGYNADPDDILTLISNLPLAIKNTSTTLLLVTSASATDTYVVTEPRITALTDGLALLFKPTVVGNTGAATIAIGALGAKNVEVIKNGAYASLSTGDVLQNGIYQITHSTTRGTFILENPSGVVVDLDSTQTLASKTLTAPKIASGGFIADANGNELIKASSVVASAVNEITVTNAIAGQAPSFSATGGDSVIDVNLIPKGATGRATVNGRNLVSKYITLASSFSPANASYVDSTLFLPVVSGKHYHLELITNASKGAASVAEISLYLKTGAGTILGGFVGDTTSASVVVNNLDAIGAVGLAGSFVALTVDTVLHSIKADAVFKCTSSGDLYIAAKGTSILLASGTSLIMTELN